MSNYLEFQAAIYDPNQPDTVPANLATLVPNGGGFTPGGRDLLKNIAGHMIANGGWTLAAVGGADPATYTLTSTGISGYDNMAVELGWDATRANIMMRMGTSYLGGVLQNPTPYFTAWPITNGASTAANNPRIINCYIWTTKDECAIVTKCTVSLYACGLGPFGLLKRWATVTPTGVNQAGMDYGAVFHAIPSRTYGASSQVMGAPAGYVMDGQISSYGISGPTYGVPQLGPTANGYSGSVANNYSYQYVINAVRVYQNYGDTSASWVVNWLNNGAAFDAMHRNNEAGATFASNIRNPANLNTALGTDGVVHLTREQVFQLKADTDLNPLLRGLLPGIIYAGPNTGNEGTQLPTSQAAGAETYKRLNVNVGFWPRMNPSGYAIRCQ